MDAQLTDFRARGNKPPKLPMPDPAELEERFAIALVIFHFYPEKAYRCNCIMCTTSMEAGSPRQHTRLYCVRLAVCNALMLFARACWLLIAGARPFIVESFGFFICFSVIRTVPILSYCGDYALMHDSRSLSLIQSSQRALVGHSIPCICF